MNRCEHCLGLGIMRVVSKHDDLETLMRCTCPTGKEQTWNLPIWISDCWPLFTRGPCPLEWFKPVWSAHQSLGTTMEHIWPKVEYWRAKILIAEQYWASNTQAVKGEAS